MMILLYDYHSVNEYTERCSVNCLLDEHTLHV